MFRTISIGSCVSIQGQLVEQLADGKIKIALGTKTYVGTAISAQKQDA